MKRTSLAVISLFVLLIPMSLSATEPPLPQVQPCSSATASPEASLAVIFSTAPPAVVNGVTLSARELPDFLPKPQSKQFVNCTDFCRQHGNVCRFSGGFCGRVCDDDGNCGCNCFYP